MMHEDLDTSGGGFAACTAGLATGGSIKIGNITTSVVENVDVQFGFYVPPGDVNFYAAPAVPPLAGISIGLAWACWHSFSTWPGVTGCGPGGVANVAVDAALDASTGLPAAPGTNSLTLTGNFDVGATTASEGSSLPQPQDDASDLLAASKASTNGEHSVKHLITMSQMKSLLTPGG